MNYKKTTDSGLFTNYLSLMTGRYRFGLVKALVNRLYKIINTRGDFHIDMEKTKLTFQKNLFLPDLIDKVVKNCLSDQYNTKESLIKKDGHYFKIYFKPRCRIFSGHAQNKINKIIKKPFKYDIKINLVFAPSIKSQWHAFRKGKNSIFSDVHGSVQICLCKL